MIARVSKNFKGSLCLPSVSQKGMVANETFWMDDPTYWKPDVQNAVSKRMIVLVGADAPPPQSIVYLTNVSNGSITVPGVGVIRAGESKGVSEDLGSSRPVTELKAAGVLRTSKREAKVAEPKRGRGRPRKHPEPEPKARKKDSSEWNPLAWNPLTENGKPAGKRLPTVLKLAENPKPLKKGRSKPDDFLIDTDEDEPEELLIDPDAEGDEEYEEEDGRVTWVDQEDTKKRLASHPILGKKNANNRKQKSKGKTRKA